jgi:predicted nucleotidyltransferase
MLTDSDIKTLKDYFENRKDVAFAVLFGSQAKGKATKLSDIDIAVYFYPEKRHPLEYEEEVFYKSEDDVCAERVSESSRTDFAESCSDKCGMTDGRKAMTSISCYGCTAL